jgi:Fur family transcriptional regulator, ferric uptake regulator
MKIPRSQLEKLLKNHKLRNTIVRREILNLFQQIHHAVSQQAIENLLNGSFDRVTIYRTLKSFEDAKLIHRVLNDDNSINYALCRDGCEHQHSETETHTHNHAHFKCEVCELTFCLSETVIPKIELPTAYVAHNLQLLVEGICKNCVKIS